MNRLISLVVLLGFGVVNLLPMRAGEAPAAARSEPTPAQVDALKGKADKGDAEAQLRLGSLYASGNGVARDSKKAAKWYRKAAEQGVDRAQLLLGLAYSSGRGVKMDKAEAVRWVRKAAEQGLVEAQLDLGLFYSNGEGVEENEVEAARWFRRAADAGMAAAQYELGRCYLEGTGVAKDISAGVRWTRKAADQGFADAENRIGLCYTKGEGVQTNYVEAYKWFDLVAGQGGGSADDARVNMAKIERFMTPAQIDEGQRLAREFKPVVGSDSPAESGSRSAGTGMVAVKVNEESCEIFVDGAFVGNSPAKLKLSDGAHVIEVKKAGFKDYRKSLAVSDGSELSLQVALEKQ